MHLYLCLKHATALRLDVDLQATTKARAFLGKQRHNTQNIPAHGLERCPYLLSGTQ